jgi:hypothetical protein
MVCCDVADIQQTLPYSSLRLSVTEWWRGVGAEVEDRLTALFLRVADESSERGEL